MLTERLSADVATMRQHLAEQLHWAMLMFTLWQSVHNTSELLRSDCVASFVLYLTANVICITLLRTLQIDKRNELRRAWAARLASNDATIVRKLQAAKQLSSEMKVLNSSDAVYTTAKDLAEQKRSKHSVLDIFDKRMRKW
jgi:hypothetical protein